MPLQYHCGTPRRRHAVREPVDPGGNPVPPALNGIDLLEVVPDQTRLAVHFLHPLPGQPGEVPAGPVLTQDNVRIEGGVRIRGIRVTQVQAAERVLEVDVSVPGDFSTYLLRLVTSPTEDSVPPGFDPQLAEIAFSFKVDCPSEFDCRSELICPPQRFTPPALTYLARDYASFRRLIFDRMNAIAPAWRERAPADVMVTLVELLAHIGDHLSYYQDAIATEAYLGTARQRRSVRRHARLLDYQVHDGCNARAWVAFEVEPGSGADGGTLPAGTMLLTRAHDAPAVAPPGELETALASEPEVFETMEAVTLREVRNAISFYTWSDASCCLPRGATQATLRNDPDRGLAAGDILLFEEIIHPSTGLEADARRACRQAVRLTAVEPGTDPLTGVPVVHIEWGTADALTFDLQISAVVAPGGGVPRLVEIAVARANVVLADHGRSVTGEGLVPPVAPESEPYRPRLGRSDLTFRVPFAPAHARTLPAAGAILQDPRAAVPAVHLRDGELSWTPRRDLLGSDRFAPEFAVETELDGTAHLRFGDDLLGQRPAAGTAFAVSYRMGNGPRGNVGAEAIGRVVTPLTGISRARNPLPATGGAGPESLEEVRQFAPQAFRRQERAVTEADWVEVAERHPEVQRAAATFRWTGSWYTVFVTIDRVGGREVDAEFETRIRDHLERYRIAGYDLEVDGPVFVPLEIELLVCVRPGFFRADIKQALLRAFANRDLPDGRRGFFHPDNFTFGQTVYLSRLIEAAVAVEGVASVTVGTFQRWRQRAAGELQRGYLKADRLEIVRCDNDPSFPENGRIEFELQGGL
jgi:hypothetical protein